MPPKVKRTDREKTAIRRLFEEKRHIGGRLPTVTEAPEEESPPENQQEELLQPPLMLPASPEATDFEDLTPEEFQTRKKGKRSEKTTGLQIVLNAVRLNGFPHPRERQGFLMLPHEFKALLALEPLAVVQVVYEVFERTIGWEDKSEARGRREWARLSIKYFQMSCGMTLSQVQRGLKGALNRGYIVRRSRLGAYEYSIRWRESDQGSA
jgi:hypothetical protein